MQLKYLLRAHFDIVTFTFWCQKQKLDMIHCFKKHDTIAQSSSQHFSQSRQHWMILLLYDNSISCPLPCLYYNLSLLAWLFHVEEGIFWPVKKPRWPTHCLWTLWENRADTSWRLKPSWYQAPEGFSGSNMPGAFVFWVPGFQLRPSFSWRTQYVVKAHEVWKIWRTQYVIQALKGLNQFWLPWDKLTIDNSNLRNFRNHF